MKQRNSKSQFVVCLKNENYPASLEPRKNYKIVDDTSASEHQPFRVIDESGVDYLYPEDYFVPIKLPQSVEKTFV